MPRKRNLGKKPLIRRIRKNGRGINHASYRSHITNSSQASKFKTGLKYAGITAGLLGTSALALAGYKHRDAIVEHSNLALPFLRNVPTLVKDFVRHHGIRVIRRIRRPRSPTYVDLTREYQDRNIPRYKTMEDEIVNIDGGQSDIQLLNESEFGISGEGRKRKLRKIGGRKPEIGKYDKFKTYGKKALKISVPIGLAVGTAVASRYLRRNDNDESGLYEDAPGISERFNNYLDTTKSVMRGNGCYNPNGNLYGRM